MDIIPKNPSKIILYNHIFFKCCSTWNECICCSKKLTKYNMRNRNMDSEIVKSNLLYDTHQEYQEIKKLYPNVLFSDFITGYFFK